MDKILHASVFVLFVLANAPKAWSSDERIEKPEVRNDVQSKLLGLMRSYQRYDLQLVFEKSRVVETLNVTNGGLFGVWGEKSFCADGSYAVGYDMQIEPRQEDGDDTALNGIKLVCGFLDGEYAGEATSAVGPWGNWVGEVKCEKSFYLTAFDLQVEEYIGTGDDTGANYVKFECQDLCKLQNSTLLDKPPGHGMWGTWGNWSAECPKHTAICGIQTKVQKPSGDRDDTALNDVIFFCCV